VRNFWAFFGDFCSYNSGMAFVGASTVLPSLLARLTDSFPLIGLVDTVHMGAWHLPQLAAAAWLAGRPCRRRYVIGPLAASRMLFVLLVPVVLFVPRFDPRLALWLLLLILAVSYLADGCGTVAWMDLYSLSLPPRGRSRLLGLIQVVSGAIGVGAGWVVARALSPAGPAFPLNYALLFAVAATFMIADVAALTFLEDVHDESRRSALRSATFLPKIGGLLANDRTFRRMVIVRLLLGFAGMATPFYIVHGLRDLGFDGSVVGLFSAAQIVGGLVAAPVFAALGGRRGNRIVIVATAALALATPLLALGGSLLRSVLPASALLGLFTALFALLGVSGNGSLQGFTNYLLDIAPADERPLYVGLSFTLQGMVLLAPFLGGWMLQATSYPALFAAAAAITLLGIAGSLALPEPRHPVTGGHA